MNHDYNDDDDERSLLQQAWQTTNASHDTPPRQPTRPLPLVGSTAPPHQPSRPLPAHEVPPPPPQQPLRPLPTPQATTHEPLPSPPAPLLPTRPLPNPAAYATARASPSPTRKSPFARPLSTPSPPPLSTSSTTTTTQPSIPSSTTNPLKKPPFTHPSSLLSREMELDRQRQAEWEEAQKATHEAAAQGQTVGPGSGPGESWDVNQYGYLGGDSQNKGALGIGGGGGRRQLVGVDPGRGGGRVGGPREMPK